MGKSYLGICEDVYRNGKWLQTETTAMGAYNTRSGSLWRGLNVRLKRTKGSYVASTNDFKDFQVFTEWYRSQAGYDLGWHLDKDLLGSGSYSEETCCLLPPTLNVLMQGIGSWKRGDKVGASYMKSRGKWRAYGNDYYSQVHLGHFDTQEQAHRQWKLDKAQRIKEACTMVLPLHVSQAVNSLIKQLTG